MVLMRNHTEQMREYFRQAVECAQQADGQTDPQLKQQFVVLARFWLTLADRLALTSGMVVVGEAPSASTKT
jgi:hypothetical protein